MILFIIPSYGLFASGTWAGDAVCQRIAALHSVEISKDGRSRDGTGVVITSDGYILTARHVIVTGAPEYSGLEAPLEVLVSSAVVGEALRARVVDVHQYIDLALLKITVPPDPVLQPLSVFTEVDGLAPGAQVCLAGFGVQQDSSGRVISYEDIKAIPATFRETSRGYFLSGAPMPTGFSGGGLFVGERYLGVNIRREMAGTATLSVPIGAALEFLRRSGIELALDGTFSSLRDFQGLLRIVANNTQKIEQLYRSVNWHAYIQSTSGGADQLVIKGTKILPDQIVEGFFDGVIFAIFKGVHGNGGDIVDVRDIPFGFGTAVIPRRVAGSVQEDGQIVIPSVSDLIKSLAYEYVDQGAGLDAEDAMDCIAVLYIEGWLRLGPKGERIKRIELFAERLRESESALAQSEEACGEE